MGKPTPAGTSASQTATLHKELAACRALLAETQNSHAQALKAAETFKIGIAERDAYIAHLQKMISDKNQRIAQLAHDLSLTEQSLVQAQLNAGNGTKNEPNVALEAQNELLTEQVNQYYQQYLADQAAIEALNQIIASIQETVQKQQQRIEELEAQLLQNNQSPNEELEAWKQAYRELYAQFSEFSTNSVTEATEDAEPATLIEPVVLVENSFDTSLQAATEDAIQPPIEEQITKYPLVEVSNHETLSEIAEQVAQVVLESPVVDSEDIMILSPSQFMSPLESSSPKSGSVEELSMSDFEPQPSEELPMIANPLPNPEASNFYPTLPAAEVAIKPATIISTEQSQQAEQEGVLETIQLQPSNPLPNPNVAIVEDAYPQLPPQPDMQRRASVSSPETQPAQIGESAEIDQVLEFFEKLPEVQEATPVIDEVANASFEMPSEFEAEVQEIEQISETLPEATKQVTFEEHSQYQGYDSQQHESQQYCEHDLSRSYEDYNQTQQYENYNRTQEFEGRDQTQEGHFDQSYNEHSNETDHFEQHFQQVYDDNQKFEQEYAGVEPVAETQYSTEAQQEYSQDPVYAQQEPYSEQQEIENYGEQQQQVDQLQFEQCSEQYTEQHWQYSDQPTEQYAELTTEQYTEQQESTDQYPEKQQEQQPFDQYSDEYAEQQQEQYAEQQQDHQSEQYPEQLEQQSTDYTDTYYDEGTNCSYGFDHSCNQYYYYNHTTGESQYYMPEEQQQQQMYANEDAASNPSIPQDHGPPLVQLQAASSEAHQTREADQVYSI